jgi:hypothetical protein
MKSKSPTFAGSRVAIGARLTLAVEYTSAVFDVCSNSRTIPSRSLPGLLCVCTKDHVQCEPTLDLHRFWPGRLPLLLLCPAEPVKLRMASITLSRPARCAEPNAPDPADLCLDPVPRSPLVPEDHGCARGTPRIVASNARELTRRSVARATALVSTVDGLCDAVRLRSGGISGNCLKG